MEFEQPGRFKGNIFDFIERIGQDFFFFFFNDIISLMFLQERVFQRVWASHYSFIFSFKMDRGFVSKDLKLHTGLE